MKRDEKKEMSEMDRQEEEAFLEQTLDVIRSNLERYGEQVRSMREEIDTMLDHFHDDNPELIIMLENTMTMYDQMNRELEQNEKAQDKPYFGRIDYYDEEWEKDESIYIGKSGISKDATHQAVVDWRAPVANAYYENGLGKCSYTAPGDKQIHIDLKLKRTYEIKKGKLLDYYESEVVANDELLTKYLAKNKQAVLGEIIATIQKEQNDIIRKSPYHNVIVQGVAGSGKTTVAMHRISFILYNYQERFKPDDFYIVGSNRILLNYITGVLPDLDVYGIRQMTMEQLFVRLLYEDWDEKKYSIKKSAQNSNLGSIKGTSGWFEDLKAYCDALEWNTILRESIYLNPKQFVEGLRDGKNGVYDTTVGKEINPYDLICLVDGEAVERYILQNPKVSMQSKINMLNDRLIIKIKEEFTGKGIKYTEAERKAILKAYRGRYGGKVWKGSIYEHYRNFLKRQAEEESLFAENGYSGIDIPKQEFDVYDLAALAYLYKRIKETEVISEAHHIVIDEAQDFGMMAYSVLDFCIEACTYTIMGDVSQNIHFGFGLNDWEELRALLLRDKMDSFGILKKSYRNTVEISDFATGILHHGQFSSYPVEPIIRHGNPVRVEQCNENDIIRKAADICRKWQEDGFETIAVVCRNQRSASLAAEALRRYIEVLENDLETAEFGAGIMVLPVEYTKGLEFDTVLILDPTREDYPVDDGHAKLLYVAATRALHELCILYSGDLTGLIADPVPLNHTVLKELEKPAKNASNTGMKEKTKAVPAGEMEESAESSYSGREASADGKTGSKRNKKATETKPCITRNTISTNVKPEKGDEKKSGTENINRVGQPGGGGRGGIGCNSQKQRLPGQKNDQTSQVPPRDSRTNEVQHNIRMGQKDGKLPGIQRPKAVLASVNPQKEQKPSPLTSLYSAKPVSVPSAKVSTNAEPLQQKTKLPGFGDIPTTEKLRPMGHSKIDLSIRWITKQSDGLYLQSRYGTLRINPVGSAIIRVSFAKNTQPASTVHPGIAVDRTEKFWMYRDSGSMVEVTTDELSLQVDKSTGAIRYFSMEEDSRNKKLLLAERKRECRQLENCSRDQFQTWLFLDFSKEEHLYAFDPDGRPGIPLKGTARYLSDGESGALPFLLSDKGYGILPATLSPVFCCDIPAYGSYLHADNEKQLDFYFIAGKRKDTILNAYAYLCGRL